MQENRAEILTRTKHIVRERSDDEISDLEAEQIEQNATKFFRLLLRWNEISSEDED